MTKKSQLNELKKFLRSKDLDRSKKGVEYELLLQRLFESIWRLAR